MVENLKSPIAHPLPSSNAILTLQDSSSDKGAPAVRKTKATVWETVRPLKVQ